MKKLFMVLFAAFLMLGIAACNGEEEARTYVADGDFTAFKIHTHSNGSPMITSVTVTIENDEIKGFSIDALQSNGTTFVWNEQSKKELGYAYRMHGQRDLSEADYITWLDENERLEWFEQAELIEAYWVANGVDSVTVDSGLVINNVSGVTIKDGNYIELAKEAVAQAKEGVTKAFTVSMSYGKPQVVWATLKVDAKGDAVELELDTLQSTITEGVFAWNEKSKQELQYAYRMHGQRDLSEADYITWLQTNEKLEWFEQADMITDYIVANGLPTSFVVQDVEALADVSITTDTYETVIKACYDQIK